MGYEDGKTTRSSRNGSSSRGNPRHESIDAKMERAARASTRNTWRDGDYKVRPSNPQPTPEQVHREFGGMKIGVPMTILMPLAWPMYLYYRSQGHGRQEAAVMASDDGWRATKALLNIIPLPVTDAVAAGMAALEHPVEKWSERSVSDVFEFGKEIAQDHEVRAAMRSAGLQIAIALGTSQGLSEDNLTKIATDAAVKAGTVAIRKSIERGDISEESVRQVKKSSDDLQRM